MKIISFLILIGICFSLFAPVTIVHSYTGPSNTAYLLTLNVCDHAGTGVVSNFDVPCVLECPCKLSVFENGQSHEIYRPSFTPLLVSNQTERPPRT